MKSILVPTDFSSFSTSALKTSAYIAQKTGASIHLLHVCPAPDDWNRMKVEQQQRFPEIEGRIVAAEMKVQKLAEDAIFKNVSVTTSVVGGSAYRQIVDYAADFKIDLIVIGAHGFNEAEGPFIGSTAQKVIRIAPCLVLSVKKNFKPTSLKKILFASNFQESKLKDAFKPIKNFAVDLKAHLDFAYINTPTHFQDSITTDQTLRDFNANQNDIRPNFFIHNDFSTEGGIINVSKKLKSNVVALVTHNRKGKSNYLMGVTETVLFHSDVPVLSKVIDTK